MMNAHKYYTLGWLYGVHEKYAGESYDPSGAKCANAHINPWRGFTDVSTAAISSGRMPQDVREAVCAASCIFDADDVTHEAAPPEMQSYWALGYNCGCAGRPLPPAPYDIAAARKAKGLTQAQLAQMIGADQAHVSRWENGTVRPSAETVEKIKKALS